VLKRDVKPQLTNSAGDQLKSRGCHCPWSQETRGQRIGRYIELPVPIVITLSLHDRCTETRGALYCTSAGDDAAKTERETDINALHGAARADTDASRALASDAVNVKSEISRQRSDFANPLKHHGSLIVIRMMRASPNCQQRCCETRSLPLLAKLNESASTIVTF